MSKKILCKSIIVLGMMIGLLVGCAKQTNLCNYDLQYGMTCSPVRLNALTKTIRHQGIQVSYLGDSIYVIIPSSLLFYQKTTCFKTCAASTLNLVARFLACYQKITVRAVGFSNLCNTKRASAIFAKKQAKVVINELWRRGSNARFVYASGSSSAKTCALANWGNRIEIITKRLP